MRAASRAWMRLVQAPGRHDSPARTRARIHSRPGAIDPGQARQHGRHRSRGEATFGLSQQGALDSVRLGRIILGEPCAREVALHRGAGDERQALRQARQGHR